MEISDLAKTRTALAIITQGKAIVPLGEAVLLHRFDNGEWRPTPLRPKLHVMLLDGLEFVRFSLDLVSMEPTGDPKVAPLEEAEPLLHLFEQAFRPPNARECVWQGAGADGDTLRLVDYDRPTSMIPATTPGHPGVVAWALYMAGFVGSEEAEIPPPLPPNPVASFASLGGGVGVGILMSIDDEAAKEYRARLETFARDAQSPARRALEALFNGD